MFRAAGTYVGRGGCDFCAPAVRLSDGTVLFTGQAPAQLYDPASDSFSPSGMTISDPSNAAALTNGDDSYIRLYREHDVATPLAYAQFAPQRDSPSRGRRNVQLLGAFLCLCWERRQRGTVRSGVRSVYPPFSY
jgi:hypothetical protein